MERNRPKSNWGEYFYSIRKECPWSYAAWQRGQIDIAQWEGNIIPLGEFQARMYIVDESAQVLEALAEELDEGEYEWLFSYPGYGRNSTPEFVLIQQDRATLTKLREKAE